MPKDAESFPAGACPIVASYGARDWTQWGAASKLERALSAAGVAHDVKEYPGTAHSFLNDHDPAGAPRLMIALACLSRSAYHELSAQDARRRILAHNPHACCAWRPVSQPDSSVQGARARVMNVGEAAASLSSVSSIGM